MKSIYLVGVGVATMLLFIGCSGQHAAQLSIKESNKECVASIDSIEILREVVDSAKDEYDIVEVALWLRNKNTGVETKIL